MEAVFKAFREAYGTVNGYQLSDTLLPSAPSQEPNRLRDFYRSTNYANVKSDIQYNVLYDRSSSLRLSTEEGKAWVDVYVAYWTAVGEILKAEESQKTNSLVRELSSFPGLLLNSTSELLLSITLTRGFFLIFHNPLFWSDLEQHVRPIHT